MEYDRRFIPMSECVHGGLYKISSRNLAFGVYDEKHQGFVGIREKFGNEYLFTEYHYDTGAPHGTVHPKELLEMCPITCLEESIGTVDGKTKRAVDFDKPVKDGGKGWHFVDTGEASKDISPWSVSNEALFKYLEEKEKEYYDKYKNVE